MPLSKSEARLECLKLAVRPGLGMDSIIATAEEYFRFVVKGDDLERDDKRSKGFQPK